MAVVLSATHVQLDALVAIKLLRPELRGERESVERFLQEGRASARIHSEHVARVFDVGMGVYGPFLVMEHLKGRDLGIVVREDGPLSVERSVDYILQACEAIAEAHAVGVIHRDLKPANVFLATHADGSECVKVLDFGISKLTSRRPGRTDVSVTNPDLLMGSPAYMSPEQASSARDVDERTDVWALGATLYELLVGEPPFGDGPSHALLLRGMTERRTPVSSVRPDVPAVLDAAISRCLTAELRERFPSVADFAHAIAACGTRDARRSAGRIARRSSALVGGWAVTPAPRLDAPLCAKALLERPEERAMIARWSGYVTAVAIVGLSFAFVVWRCDSAVLAETRAAADFAPPETLQELQEEPSAFIPPAMEGSAPRERAPLLTGASVSSAPSRVRDTRDAGAPAREILPPIDDAEHDAADNPYSAADSSVPDN